MRLFKFILPVICVLSLSACSGTWQTGEGPTGALTSSNSVKKSQADEPAKLGIVLKPPGIVQQPLPPPAEAAPPDENLVWRQLSNYDAGNFPRDGITPDMAPIGTQVAGAKDYNEDVQIFPLDGGDVTAPVYTDETPVADMHYGGLQQQVFFRHASSKVKPADAKKLRELARRVKGRDVAVTVVGHASHRVDHVKDPLKKKMINFAMAQKRANAVTHELKKAGMKPAWVQAVSKGDEEPNANPGDMPQEAADRRAEVYMDEK